MEHVWTEAAKQVPVAVVLALAFLGLGSMFLRYLQRQSTDGQKLLNRVMETIDTLVAKHDSAVRDMGANCHEHQTRIQNEYAKTATKMTVALDRNSEQLGRNTQVMSQVDDVLEDLERRLPKPA